MHIFSGICRANGLSRTICCFLVTLSCSAQARISDPQSFDIPAGALEDSLYSFSQQSRLQVLFDSDAIQDVTARPVRGELKPTAALSAMLDGTALAYQFVNDRTIAIVGMTAKAREESQAVGREKTEENAEFHLALAQANPREQQAVARSGEKYNSEPANTNRRNRGDRGDLLEVVVTGSRIRAPAPVGAELITIDQAQIDASGHATVQEIIRTLPQNSAGLSEEFSSGREGPTNSVLGTALNLRGLGAGATLVLVNGRRLAPTGSQGIFTDVSSIPLSAVERIEVLLDGASSIYGSDAIGGVVNIVLRRDYRGAETRARLGTVTSGAASEYQIGQSLGTSWDSGQGMFAYEFYRREPLLATERTLTASRDLRPFGGTDFRTRQSNPGNILIGTRIWAIPSGQDGSSLESADLIEGTFNLGNANEGRDLLPEQRRHSIVANATQNFGQRTALTFSGLYSQRDALRRSHAPVQTFSVTSLNPFYVNPTGGTGPVRVAYDFHPDFGPQLTDAEISTSNLGLTLVIEAPRNWRVTAEAAHGREDWSQTIDGFVDAQALSQALRDPNPETAFNPFADGSFTNPLTIASLRAHTEFGADSRLRTAGVNAEGAVARLPGGDIRLALGAEHRYQDFRFFGIDATGVASDVQFDRTVKAAFGELLLPLVGANNSRAGIHHLALSLSGRHEKYSDFGSSTNPKIGIEWAPIPTLQLRASWSTSFKAPNVFDLDEGQNISGIVDLPDATSATGFTSVLVWAGNNSDLREETSDNRTIGLAITSPANPLTKIAFTYFDIEFKDRIETVSDFSLALEDPTLRDIVIPSPTAAQIEAVCSRGTFLGDPIDCRNSSLFSAIVDARTNNSAIVKNRGVDLLASYSLQRRSGTYSFTVNATRLLEFSRALRATSSLDDVLDTPLNPVDLRLRGSLAWNRGSFGAGAFLNYLDSYRDEISDPLRKIGSWTTLDLMLSYATPQEGPRPLDGTTIFLNLQNAFDQDPPFFNNPNGLGYDAVNTNILGRFVSVQLRKAW